LLNLFWGLCNLSSSEKGKTVSDQRGKVVLIIDDEQLIRLQVRTALEGEGFIVHEAANGNEGLTRIALAIPDLVITDILMPDKEGIETILELRRRYPSIRIIAISGGGRTGNKDFLRTAKHLGADRTLAKPFGLADLLKLVREVLAEAEQAAAAAARSHS
jgi:CheY-like chemotaxis protein